MVSIIIPAYNEAENIGEVLECLPCNNRSEIIVVDGQSHDRTVEFARKHHVKVISSVKNRAMQMNAGARAAKGDILLFLHADCLLEDGALTAITDHINNGYIGGCLTQKIRANNILYRIIEISGNIRARVFKVFYGDQAIFAQRDIFFKLGGFDNIPIFEDILFSRKMRRDGRTKALHKKVFTSPRRWEKEGIVKTTLVYWLLSLGYIFNLPYGGLKRIYHDIR